MIFQWICIDFGWILEGFWEIKMMKKSKFWIIFWVCFWRLNFWLNFVGFLIKTMVKNMWNFQGCLRCCFIICLLNLLFSVMLETLKIVIFPRGNHYFYKISFFAFDVQRCRKLVKKQWIGRVKGLHISMKFGC